MHSFDTPTPISVSVELSAGDVHVTASARGDTVVHVRPSDEHEERDVRAAEQTQVDLTAGRLVVRGPKQTGLGIFNKVGVVEISIELPAGSALEGKLGAGAFRCTGDLAACRLRTGAGDVQIGSVASAHLRTGYGAILAERVAGDADLSTGSGRLSIRGVGGRAVLKNSNGDTWVGEVAGDLRVSSANGQIAAEHAGASITANTANGDILIGELVRGSSTLRTAAGRIEIGIRSGTAARLDLHTGYGKVRSDLENASGPADTDERAEVHARTSFGDILIHRS